MAEEMLLTLVAADAGALAAGEAAVRARFGDHAVSVRELQPGEALDLAIATPPPDLRAALETALGSLPMDWALQPAGAPRQKRLLISDMDSTIIGCECIDELADYAGKKPEIAAITERAMRGELDFEAALKERVGMLAGLPLDTLHRAYDERVRLNPGAGTLVATMAAHGARAVLVSGGFTFFTERVAAAAGFHAHRANRLEDNGAALTGRVHAPILGRAAKKTALEEECAALGIAPAEALALGDGANDLDMIRAAGLGVAYRAKPIVAAEAMGRIAHTSLEAALFFQGYPRKRFVSR